MDRAGRNWSLHTYASMATRTASRQAEVLAVLTADPEHDLYKISSHGTTCALCAPYEGRVYSKSGTDPVFPPLAAAFGKIDPAGADDLANTWLNIHPNCLHVLMPWTPAGRSEKEIREIQDFSNPRKNPFAVDPRSKKQIEAYRKKEKARAKWLDDYRQYERYRVTIPDDTPKTFNTFLKHKLAGDGKYKEWERLYRWENKRLSFQPLIGKRTSTGIEITGISKHAVDRAVSRGFDMESALDALQNPIKVGTIKIDDDGFPSQKFRGKNAEIVVNPENGNIISGWRK